jgi:hypothetical protein
MILERDGLNDAADKDRDRSTAGDGHVGPIQPLAGGLLQPPRDRVAFVRA